METVPVDMLTEIVTRASLSIEDEREARRELRVALQGAGYPPDAEQISAADAVAILERLDAGIIRPA